MICKYCNSEPVFFDCGEYMRCSNCNKETWKEIKVYMAALPGKGMPCETARKPASAQTLEIITTEYERIKKMLITGKSWFTITGEITGDYEHGFSPLTAKKYFNQLYEVRQ